MTVEKSRNISLVLKGMAMGIAEVIPGVSGGTIAFITGIYERLLASISAFGPGLIKEYKESGLAGVWNKVDGWFLIYLVFGMFFGAAISVFGVSYLIENYPEPLWAFFFGLIIASSIFIWKQIDRVHGIHYILFLVGAIVAYGIVTISPVEGSTHPAMIFISGFIAITAFILPGISGSFILLLMGMYTIIIPTIKSFLESPSSEEFSILAIFGIGCMIGLMLFSRILTWTFRHYQFPTYAVLTGFMVASLVKIWPWKNPSSVLDKTTLQISNSKETLMQWLSDPAREIKVLEEVNVMPGNYDLGSPHTLAVICSALLGLAIVWFIARWTK